MKTRRKQRETRVHAGRWTALVLLAGIGLALFGCYQGVIGLIDEWCSDLPSIEDTNAFEMSEQSTIVAADYDPDTGEGTVLAELYLENREPLDSLDEISSYVVDGTVATEDERFYQHNGIDIQGIIRAVFVNLAGGQEGASTITQQLVRNTLLSDEATEISIKRKVREMELAIEMEKVYSKDEILLMYLNTINYGDGCYGIQAAAEHYFGVDASDLTIAQAATLIGIPNSPSTYNPYVNADACLSRRNVVLARMLANDVITQEEYEEAIAEGLNVLEEDSDEDDSNGIYRYEYFTTYVRELLLTSEDEGGWGLSTSDLFEGGLTIVTTIDPTMQEYAEEAVATQYASGSVGENQEFALTLVDPNTGYIKAMIGGKDFDEDQFNIATSTSGRPIGSTAKAFTLTDAIEKGINPETTMMNCSASVEVTLDDGTTHTVSNFNSRNYGTLSIADMTAVSSNTGYIRLSVIDSDESGVTPTSIVEMQERLGLTQADLDGTSKLPAVATTTLGVGQANTTEMASAYGTFATGGVYRKATPIIKVIDSDGNTIGTDYSSGVEGEEVLSAEVSYAVTQVLETVITKGTATAAALPSGQEAAGKTGTTDNWHDLWFVGYTPQLSCAVWTGDRSNEDTYSSNTWCQEIWRDLISDCLDGESLEEFEVADSPTYDSDYTGSYGSSSSSSSSGSSSSSSSTNSSSDGETTTDNQESPAASNSSDSSSSNSSDSSGSSSDSSSSSDAGSNSGSNSNSGSDSSSNSGSGSDSSGSTTTPDTGDSSSGSSDSDTSDNSGTTSLASFSTSSRSVSLLNMAAATQDKLFALSPEWIWRRFLLTA